MTLEQTNTSAEDKLYAAYADEFIRALKHTKGQPLHDYLIKVVQALSSERAKWMFALEEGSNNPPAPK